jgi:hypothetical protein
VNEFRHGENAHPIRTASSFPDDTAVALAESSERRMVPRPTHLRMRITLITLLLLMAGGYSSGHDEVTPKPKVLQNGVPQGRLSADDSDGRVYVLTVPPGAKELVVKTREGTGDADIYLRRGAHPTTLRFDHKSRHPQTQETIRVESPEAGLWYVLVDAFNQYRGVKLTATYRMLEEVLLCRSSCRGPGSTRARHSSVSEAKRKELPFVTRWMEVNLQSVQRPTLGPFS